ncbi:MAG TPA: TlpA disulfide reductase family protein [Pyrinomonadaceae bacterium]|jgi:cytochrome c biogenesis protein CcmG/thiol:disulfide interchange protein DsbE
MPSAFIKTLARLKPQAFIKTLWPHSGIFFLALCLLNLLLFGAACNKGPSETATESNTNTPAGTRPPRAMYPMPPVTAAPAHDSAGKSEQVFTLLDNRRMRLSDYKGSVVVLDFYATWCPPCRVETPHLVQLQRRYGPQGLNVIGLNVGGPDDKYKIPDYVKEFGIQYTLGFPDPEMTNLYLSDDDRIPQAFVFDRQGRLLKRFISYDDSMPAELERIIREALAAK